MFPSIDITCTLTAFITGLKGKQVATHLPSFQRLMLNLLTGAEACLAMELSGVHPICICACSWGIPSAKPSLSAIAAQAPQSLSAGNLVTCWRKNHVLFILHAWLPLHSHLFCISRGAILPGSWGKFTVPHLCCQTPGYISFLALVTPLRCSVWRGIRRSLCLSLCTQCTEYSGYSLTKKYLKS